ncbi:phosphatase PAP2 family protein [Streptomyces sp. J2-1]|uniref:phosphatase PAP2 family protein n=1 Tax=Streptomyces corallincola TaxID=2851888 RepID=UPI001C390CEA|nr:phosphatase PAP2 family protein [Streptomyces corallincola]MBV2353933.1 phosphatase PAP2 family protein [Streptomyces corallincola]
MTVTAVVAVLLMALVYAVLVLTVPGQLWEDAVLVGRHQDETLAAAHEASRTLDHITATSLGLAVLLLAAVGLLRRRYALTAVAVGCVAVSLLLAEVLKRFVLPRPDLTEAPRHLLGNSFPSGHTSIAMSVMFGLVLVVPYRMRGLAAGLCFPWAAFVGAYTVAAGWHRPSDTFGADLLVLAVACALTAALARAGLVRPGPARRFPLRFVFVVVPLALVAVVGLLTGAVLLEAMPALPSPGPRGPALAYRAGHALAAGASALTALCFLALLRRVDLDRPSSRADT